MRAIEASGLSYTYPKGKSETLSSLSFEVDQGGIFGFLGPSGAGKSTTQKILYRILQGYQGQVKISGKDLKSWDDSFYHHIGVGFELPNHYLKLTGFENIQLFAQFYHRHVDSNRIKDLFAELDLADDLDKNVEDYSKGMKMRLNFIRAIYHKPKLLFLDEPTAGLDPVNAKRIKDKIKKLKSEGTTIFLTTHNMDTADQLCDQVALIFDGSLKVVGSPSDLKKKYSSSKVEVQLRTGTTIFPLKGIGMNQNFLQAIKSDDLVSIHTAEETLESVFLKVTGEVLNG